MNLHLLQKRVLSVPDKFFAEKYAENMSFCFSTYQLSNSATRTVRGRNIVTNDEQDIGFENNAMSLNQIATLGGGSEVVAPIFYNQKGSYIGNLNAVTAIATRPAIVDNLNNPVNYIRSRVQGQAYWTPSTVASAPVIQNDYIISFVQRLETGPNNQRPTFYIKTSSSNLITGMFRPFGSSLSILARENAGSWDFKSIVPVGFNNNFGLFTLTKINGIFNIYFNGVQGILTNFDGNTDFNVDSRGGAGVGFNSRPVLLASGRTNEFQSYIFHTGSNLSSFPLTDYMNDLKLIHGIA